MPRSRNCLAKMPGLIAGEEDEQGIRAEVTGALQERRKIRVVQRHPHGLMICAPPLVAASLNVVSDSTPGAQSLTMVTIFLAPFFTAQSAMIEEDWPSVKLVRTI